MHASRAAHAQVWPPLACNPHHALQVFADYVKAAFVPEAEAGTFDLVSIDGRARVACFPRALQLLKPHGGVLVLDNAERPYYRWGLVVPGKMGHHWEQQQQQRQQQQQQQQQQQ